MAIKLRIFFSLTIV